jgi:hypothetical protein
VLQMIRKVCAGVSNPEWADQRYSAWWKPTGRRTSMLLRPADEPNAGCGVRFPGIFGRWATLTLTCWVTVDLYVSSKIAVTDARSGRTFHPPLPHKWSHGRPPTFFVTAAVLDRCGDLAYAYRLQKGVEAAPGQHLLMWRSHERAVRLYEGGLDSKSVRIRRHEVTWTTHGDLMRARIPWPAC